MVIGERFAWAHVPKTAGDLTVALFYAVVPNLVIEADPVTTRRKHHGFVHRGVADRRILAANLRRLPSHQLSVVMHTFRHGDGRQNHKPLPMWSPDQVASSTRADRLLSRYMVGGRLRVTHWLRMEHLRDDFVAFVSQLRRLSEREREMAMAANPEKRVPVYDHDPAHFFTREQIVRLYENNPLWASTELDVYGDLAIPEEAEGREPGVSEAWWEPFVHPVPWR
jgi:hypothetical protein